MLRTDSELRRDVLDELAWDPAVGRSRIHVMVNHGLVSLMGLAQSCAERYAAIRAAERVAGVRVVSADLRVRLDRSSRRGNIQLAQAVLETLRWQSELPANATSASVDDGWVTLEGEVEWQYQKTAAEDAVRQLTGVTHITNHMTLARRVSVTDVKERIVRAFERRAALDSSQISVAATGGVVTLSGNVASSAEREDAERAAWSEPGITSVCDELSVHA